MALRAPLQNPSKPLRPKHPLVSSFRSRSLIPMARQTRWLPSIAASLHHDAAHRDEVLRAARGSLGHCLSETHLEITVPGLTSKARGKVCSSLRCFVIHAVGEFGGSCRLGMFMMVGIILFSSPLTGRAPLIVSLPPFPSKARFFLQALLFFLVFENLEFQCLETNYPS